MTDIAKLGFEADTADLTKATAALDKLASKGPTTAAALDKAAAALDRVEKQGSRLDRSLDKVEKALGDLNRKNTETARSTRAVEDSMSRLERQGASVSRTFGQVKSAILALGLVRLGQGVVNAGVAFQKMETTLKFATGSLEGARAEIGFVRAESERLGQDFLTAGRAYAKLSASASQLGLTTEETRKVFTGVSSAATVMGLSSYEAEGAFLALQQMLAKGKVTAEELTGQLGERMPTAIADAADALGVTTPKLFKMLEQGQIKSADFVTKLAALWNDKFGSQIPTASQNATIAINDFGNAVQDLQIGVAQSGFLEGVTAGLEAAAKVLSDPRVMEGARTFGEFIGGKGGEAIGGAFVLIAEHGETVLRVFAAIGGALKGATLGAAVGGPAGALFGALLGGGAGALSPEILTAIFGAAEEAGQSLEELRENLAEVEESLAFAKAEQEAYGDAAVGAAMQVAFLTTQVELARAALDKKLDIPLSDDEFMNGVMGGIVAPLKKAKTAVEEFSKAQESAFEKLKTQVALLGLVGSAQAKVNALVDTGAASLEAAIKIAKDETTVLTERQRKVLSLVDAIDKERRATEDLNAEMQREQALMLEDEQALQEAERRYRDLEQAKSRLVQNTNKEVAANKRLVEVTKEGERAVRVYNEAEELRRENGLLSADAAGKLADALVESQLELERVQSAAAELDGMFSQAFESIGDAITQAFATGEISAVSFKNIAKAALSEVIQWAVKLSLINPLKNALSGAGNLPTFGDIGGLFGGASGAGGGMFGGGFNPLSLLNSGSGGGLYNSFAMSGIGQSLGLSYGAGTLATNAGLFAAGSGALGTFAAGGPAALALTGPAGGFGSIAGLATASTGGAVGAATAGGALGASGGLTGLGASLGAAAGPLAIAAMAAMLVGPMLFGGGPTVGPVGIADFSPGLGRGNEFSVDGISPYTADNGGDGEAMRPIAEAVATLIADTADRFDAMIEPTLRFRIANYAGPESGSGRMGGFEVNGFIRGEAEKRVAEGLSQEQAMFEALKFAVQEAFTFDSGTLTEAAMNSVATTTEGLLADLEYALDFDSLQTSIADLGGVITTSTLAQARLQIAIEKQAEQFATDNATPIVDSLRKAIELFPGMITETITRTVTDASAAASDLAGTVDGLRPGESRFVDSFGNEFAGTLPFGLDADRDADGRVILPGTVEGLGPDGRPVFPSSIDDQDIYIRALEDAATVTEEVARQSANYAANLERVGLAVDMAKAGMDLLVDQITGDFEPAVRGPFQQALDQGQANLDALRTHFEDVNAQIEAANDAFPELNESLIDVTQAISDAQAALLANLQEDFRQQVADTLDPETANRRAFVDASKVSLTDAVSIGLGGDEPLMRDLFRAFSEGALAAGLGIQGTVAALEDLRIAAGDAGVTVTQLVDGALAELRQDFRQQLEDAANPEEARIRGLVDASRSTIDDAVALGLGSDGSVLRNIVTSFTDQVAGTGASIQEIVSALGDLSAAAGDAGVTVTQLVDGALAELRQDFRQQLEDAANPADARIRGLVDASRSRIDDAVALGLGGDGSVLQNIVTAFVDSLGEAGTGIQDVIGALGDLSAEATDAGVSISSLTASAIATLRDTFTDSLTAQLNDATGLGGVNSLNSLLDVRDVNRTDALALGLDTDLADDVFEAQVRRLLEGMGAATVSTIQSSGQVVDDLLVSLIADYLDAAAVTDAATAARVLEGIAIEDQIAAQQELIATRRKEAAEAQRLADQAGNNARTLRAAYNATALDSSLSPLSPEDRMTQAIAQFDEAFAAANDNTPLDVESQDAVQRLPDLQRAALEAAQSYYGSSSDYNTVFARLQRDLLSTATTQESIEAQQLTVLHNIEDALLAMGAANDNSPSYISNGAGQFISTGQGGVAAGLDLGRDPENNLKIARAFAAAGLTFPGAGEGQIDAMRASNPLAEAILSAMGFADGGAFFGGNVIPFARGGVVNRTTLFPMGMMGEAGPEAIMPLERGSDGALGVKTNGGGSDRLVFLLVERFERMESLLEAIERNTAAVVAEARKANAKPRPREKAA